MQFTRVLSYRFPLIRGDEVRTVQLALISLHANPPCGSADGIYGQATQAAVRGFQHAHNIAAAANDTRLEEDGVVGSDTWNALFRRADAAGAVGASIRGASQALSPTPDGPFPKPLHPDDMPVDAAGAAAVKRWLMTHFADQITAAVANTPFDADLVCAIAAKETAFMWLPWVRQDHDPQQILAACVGDASGDAAGTTRQAFPQNRAQFRDKFGDGLTQQLIDAANKMRELRGKPHADLLYKGYGIFQYDLQNIEGDEAFFRESQWGDMAACLDRLMRELREKLRSSGGDVFNAVLRYNGGGAAAREYAAQVMQIREWCRQETV